MLKACPVDFAAYAYGLEHCKSAVAQPAAQFGRFLTVELDYLEAVTVADIDYVVVIVIYKYGDGSYEAGKRHYCHGIQFTGVARRFGIENESHKHRCQRCDLGDVVGLAHAAYLNHHLAVARSGECGFILLH